MTSDSSHHHDALFRRSNFAPGATWTKRSPRPKAGLPLPVVVPVVLHHSGAGWSAAKRLECLFDQSLVADREVLELIPRFGFVLDDISQLSDEALEARALGLVPALTLWALRDARSPTRLVKSFSHWANAMAELVAAPNGSEALWSISRYIALVADDSVTDTLSRAFDAAKPEVKEAIMTLAERWQAEGEARASPRERPKERPKCYTNS